MQALLLAVLLLKVALVCKLFKMLKALAKKEICQTRYSPEVSIKQRGQLNYPRGSASYKQDKISRFQLLLEFDAIRELERKRLARELHDQMGQDLTALALGLCSLKKEFCSKSKANYQLEHLQMIVSQINQQVHDIALGLRPLILDDLGLQAALFSLFEKWSVSTGIKVDFQCSGLDKQRLHELVETGVYRIIQEALTNVSKHAWARNVFVILLCLKDHLIVSVTDDGCGFDTSLVKSSKNGGKCLGILGMQERVDLFFGTFEVVSAKGNGTSVKLSIPLNPKKKR